MDPRLIKAIELCQKIEPMLRTHDMHCAITGSTIYGMGKLGTDIDIDILIYPHNGRFGRKPIDVSKLYDIFRAILVGDLIRRDDAGYNHVIVYFPDAAQKIDFIPVPVDEKTPPVEEDRFKI